MSYPLTPFRLGCTKILHQQPILKADVFKRFGLTPPRGILLHGPPGCDFYLIFSFFFFGGESYVTVIDSSKRPSYDIVFPPFLYLRCAKTTLVRAAASASRAGALACNIFVLHVMM